MKPKPLSPLNHLTVPVAMSAPSQAVRVRTVRTLRRRVDNPRVRIDTSNKKAPVRVDNPQAPKTSTEIKTATERYCITRSAPGWQGRDSSLLPALLQFPGG